MRLTRLIRLLRVLMALGILAEELWWEILCGFASRLGSVQRVGLRDMRRCGVHSDILSHMSTSRRLAAEVLVLVVITMARALKVSVHCP